MKFRRPDSGSLYRKCEDGLTSLRHTVQVSKTRLDAWGASTSSVLLYHFEDGDYVGYDTRPAGETDTNHYVTAQFSGPSAFDVGVEQAVLPTPTATPVPTKTATAVTATERADGTTDQRTTVPVEEDSGLLGGFVVALVLVAIAIGLGVLLHRR